MHVALSPSPDSRNDSHRLATEEELQYLRRFNRIRLLRYLMFLTIIALMTTMAAFFPWMAVKTLANGDMGIAALFLMCSLLLATVFFIWLRPVVPGLIRMRPMLRIPAEVQVSCFKDQLHIVMHPTDHADNIFAAGRRGQLLELPSHWETQLPDHNGVLSFEVARISGASDKVLRLRMNNANVGRSRSRLDSILPDLGNFVLRLEDLSISREMRARQPVIRAHSTLAIFGFSTALLCFFFGLSLWVLRDRGQDDATKLRKTIETITQYYDSGSDVPAKALEARGLTELRPDPEFGAKVLHSRPVSFYEVSLHLFADPFYLTKKEITAILRISTVFPKNMPGSGPASAELIAEYRSLLVRRAEALAAISPEMRQKIIALPDDMVARQLRALSLSNWPDQSFIAALLPQPMIAPRKEETSPYLTRPEPACYPGDTLCGQRDQPRTYNTPIFMMQDQVITLQKNRDINTLTETRAKLQALKASAGRRTFMVAAWALIQLLSIVCFLTPILARRRIRRWYRATRHQEKTT